MPYKGTIEVISGLKQANNQDFALAKTHDIWADEPDKRLDQVIEDIIGGDSGSLRTKADKANTVLDTYLSRGRLDGSQIGTNSFAFGDDVVAEGAYSHAEGGGYSESSGDEVEEFILSATGNYSHAEGQGTQAVGDASHAEGQKSRTYEDAAHAEGFNTQAKGVASHAEGNTTIAQGAAAHAEGSIHEYNADGQTLQVVPTANGIASHVEGQGTTAIGNASHAEGRLTTASGDVSHVEGSWSKAVGDISHAEGFSSAAYGANSHAEGTSTETGAENDSSKGASAHAEGENTHATANYSHAEGYGTSSVGEASHTEGRSTRAEGVGAHAEGIETKATGPAAHAEGDNTTASKTGAHAEGTHTNAFGYDSHAEGMYTNANDSAHAEGQGTYANGVASHAEGMYTIAAAESSHVGGTYNVEDSYASWPEFSSNTYYPVGAKMKYTQNTSGGMVSTGYICKIAHTSGNSIATPYWTEWGEFGQKMNYAEIVGNGTSSARSNARALDWDGNEYLKGDIYVNCDANSANGNKVATEGYVSTSYAPLASPALTGTPTAPTAANGTNTTQIATTAFVMNAFTVNDAMVFKGTLGTGGTVTSLPATHQVGWSYKVITAGTYAGQKCEIGDLVICIGTAGTNADWVVVQSNLDGAVTGPASATVGHVAVFNNTNGKIIKDSGYTIQTSVPPNAVFTDTTYESKTAASGGTDVSLVTTGEKYNWNNKANAIDTVLYTTLSRGRKDDTDIGRASFAFGTNVEATKMNSHAEGSHTHATATQAHAEGYNSTASAQNSHAEGNNTVASGVASHAEGYESTASNIASHAEGWPSTASGIASHAEGLRTTASNSASHAEGADTTASGTNSHAEGNATTASGNDSHAEGTGTFAAADFSHVGGAYNVADSYANWPEYEYGKFYDIGDKAKITTYSQADEVVTYYVCKRAHMPLQQFVEENWDEWGNKMNYVEIIGNGKDDSNRSNVRALGWDGNEYLAGDVYVNCNYLSKQGRRLATEYYVQSQISTITNAQIDALFD